MGSTESSTTRSSVATAASPAERWRSRLRATTYALYRFLGEDERLGHLVLVDLRSGGERLTQRIGVKIEAFSELIDEGRALPSAPPTLTRVTAEALGGAIFHELCLAAARDTSPPPESELVPMLMYSAVLPYAGKASAAEELRIAPPPR